MPAIVLGEVSSCTNPLLPFFYQEEGFLKDIYALSYAVYPMSSGTPTIDKTAINMDACADGGDKVGTGYYIAPVDPTSDGLAAGPYEIVWYYTVEDGGVELTTAYYFEVLDSTYFRVSGRYRPYAPSNIDALDGFDLHVKQKAILQASRSVERLTGRMFFPQHMLLRHAVRPSARQIWLQQPVIGISGITIEEESTVVSTLSTFDVSTSILKVYNRHLEGLLSPDDRANPKIAFATFQTEHNLLVSMFPRGELNLKITGAFGYTDPNNGPMGETPSALLDVIQTLAYRQVADPTGTSQWLQNPSTVKMAKTRSQQIVYDTGGGSSGGTTGDSWLTGDERLDEILREFMRPPHVGVAG